MGWMMELEQRQTKEGRKLRVIDAVLYHPTSVNAPTKRERVEREEVSGRTGRWTGR